MLRPGRLFAASAALVVAALSLASCGGGYSEEDATTFCDQERAAITSSCIDDEVYAQCRSCYEECGPDCDRGGACPETYACVE